MGQQCCSNSTTDSNQFSGTPRKGGVTLSSYQQKRSSSPNKSVTHFSQINMSNSKLKPKVDQIQKDLYNFQHSATFVPPKGISQPEAYVLNSNGLIYKENSEWKDGMPHGRGELLYPDGSYYVGYMYKGVPHGEGRFISSQGWYYQGQLQNQQAEGKGVFVYQKNGYKYQGSWAGDLPDGQGKQTWKNQNGVSIYEGDFLNGKKHGYGKYRTENFSYEGNFSQNQIDGEGKIKYSNGQSFEGDFLNGKKHGYGIYKWPDNSSYEGSYKNDLKHGYGKFISPDSKVFEGQWIEGKREGKGVLISQNKKYNYEWKKDLPSNSKKNA